MFKSLGTDMCMKAALQKIRKAKLVKHSVAEEILIFLRKQSKASIFNTHL